MPQVILTIIVVTSVAAVVRWVRSLLRPAGELSLSLFQPYRGDTWPRGVQEDYDVQFDWTPRKPPAAPIQPSWAEIVVAPTADEEALPGAGAVDEVEIEELFGETAAIEHVQGDIHIAPH